MNRLFSYCVTAAIFILCSCNLDAAVFERDWQTPGDGLLTYDDVNRREWLDLTVSRVDQFPEPWLDNAVAETGPGGLFEGFRWAKRNDVISFAESAGIDTTTSNPLANEVPVIQLITLLGVTAESMLTARSLGFIDENAVFGQRVGADVFANRNFVTGEISSAGLIISASDDLLRLGSTGLMLYRTVPEPSALYMIVFGLYAMIRIQRSRRV
jgi:hypothetical protein